MKNISFLFILLFSASGLFTGCNLDEEELPTIERNLFSIPDDLQEWLLPFDSVGLSLAYVNDADSIVPVIVERTFTPAEQNFSECRINDIRGECEFNSVNIAFPEGIHPDNFQAFISIFSIAPNEVQVMANRIGFSAAIAKLNRDTAEIITEIPDNYTASFNPEFDYNGVERPAITIETITLENVPDGAIIAPDRMILVRGVGVVEWDDFNGNTWRLQN